MILDEEEQNIVNNIVKSSKSKLILGAFTKNYGDKLVGLMSWRISRLDDYKCLAGPLLMEVPIIKRINTIAFEKNKGIGTRFGT